MDMKMNKLNFVIIGTGMISSTHADAINDMERANLLGVFDKDTERAKAFAEKYNIKAYDGYEAVLSDSSVDAVCLCTPSGFHAEQAIAALENGKNVVVEKPMALTAEDCDRVIETVKKTGKTLTVICQLRFSEDVQKLKKLYEEKAFGTVSLCNTAAWTDRCLPKQLRSDSGHSARPKPAAPRPSQTRQRYQVVAKCPVSVPLCPTAADEVKGCGRAAAIKWHRKK